MEFFIPSLLIFLLAMIVSFAVIPRLSPLILAVLSAGLLSFGVYHHYNMFKSEYRLSTWQDGIKIYAPAIMIIAIIVFIIIGILSFFTGARVPVPSMPNVTIAPESATNAITSALNDAVKSVVNVTNDMKNAVIGTNNTNKGANNKTNNKTNKINNGISRSLLEVI